MQGENNAVIQKICYSAPCSNWHHRLNWGEFAFFIIWGFAAVIIFAGYIIGYKKWAEGDEIMNIFHPLLKYLPKKYVKVRFAVKCVFCAAMGIAIFVVITYNLFAPVFYTSYKYFTGNYETVNGEVEEYSKEYRGNVGRESFVIDGVRFSYSCDDVCGYNKIKGDGGIVKGDGQELQVGYVEYKNSNIIVLIEPIGE